MEFLLTEMDKTGRGSGFWYVWDLVIHVGGDFTLVSGLGIDAVV